MAGEVRALEEQASTFDSRRHELAPLFAEGAIAADVHFWPSGVTVEGRDRLATGSKTLQRELDNV